MQVRGSRRRHRVWWFDLSASQILWKCEEADAFTQDIRLAVATGVAAL
jgi:hypothetical protein